MAKEQRAAQRYSVRVSTEYESSDMGSGFTENVSLSGALIEYASRSLPLKTKIRLRFSFFVGSFDTVFLGTVVRHTEDGFAVRFRDMDGAQLAVLRKCLRLSPTGSG